MKLVGICGCLTPRSKTRVLVNETLAAAKQYRENIETELLDLHDYSIEFCDGRRLADYNEDTRRAVELIISADAFIIGSPIYQASITGALKNLIDLVPMEAFRHKAVGCLANGGTFQHFLVLENQLKPILGYFRSYIAPGFVYAHTEHFGPDKNIEDQDVLNRITLLAKDVIDIQEKMK